jgi:rubrerythrin
MNNCNDFHSVEEALDFAIQREKDSQAMYLDYASRTDRVGLRSLLVSMAGQEKGHERSLRELRANRAVSSLFSKPKVLDLKMDEYSSSAAFDPEMSYQDFLLLVIHKEEEAHALYRGLEACSIPDDLRFLFRGLAEEEKRHKALAQDRYDLEILTEN